MTGMILNSLPAEAPATHQASGKIEAQPESDTAVLDDPSLNDRCCFEDVLAEETLPEDSDQTDDEVDHLPEAADEELPDPEALLALLNEQANWTPEDNDADTESLTRAEWASLAQLTPEENGELADKPEPSQTLSRAFQGHLPQESDSKEKLDALEHQLHGKTAELPVDEDQPLTLQALKERAEAEAPSEQVNPRSTATPASGCQS